MSNVAEVSFKIRELEDLAIRRSLMSRMKEVER